VPYRSPDPGSPPNTRYLQDFRGLGVNRIGSCFFSPEQHFQPDPDFEIAIAIMIAIENRSGKIGDRF
jgi:hypothetical protein